MELRGNWNYPTTVRFGAGRASEIGEAVKAAKITNPLFVTDPVVARVPMTAAAMQVPRRCWHTRQAVRRRAAQSGRVRTSQPGSRLTRRAVTTA